jgi:putative ABC transport system permease protein
MTGQAKSVWQNLWEHITHLGVDMSYAWRSLLRDRRLMICIVTLLALGIATTSIAFSVLYATILRPLPYKQSNELIGLWETNSQFPVKVDRLPLRAATFAEWRHALEGSVDLLAFQAHSVTVNSMGEPAAQLIATQVSSEFFDVLGVAPILGSSFHAGSGGDPASVVISFRLWKQRFRSRPNIIGEQIRVNERSATIIGVMPGSFGFPHANEFPAFMGFAPQTDIWDSFLPPDTAPFDFGGFDYAVLGRLRNGETVSAVRDVLANVTDRLAKEHPDAYYGAGIIVAPFKTSTISQIESELLLLQVSAAAILIVGCLSLTNLLIARAHKRFEDLTLRLALGASMGRIVTLLICECLLTSGMSAILSFLMIVAWTRVLAALAPASISRLNELHIGLSGTLFTIAITVISGVLLAVPTVLVALANLHSKLGAPSARSTESIASRRIRNGLLAAQVALSATLIISALKLGDTLKRALYAGAPIDARNIVTMNVTLPISHYATMSDRTSYLAKVFARLNQQPEVEAAGIITTLPLSGEANFSSTTIRSAAPPKKPGTEPLAEYRFISGQYFSAMGLRFIAGRPPSVNATDEVVVSQAFVTTLLHGEQLLGQSFKRGEYTENKPWWRIVGVVADTGQTGLTTHIHPQVYVPYSNNPIPTFSVVVRCRDESILPRRLAGLVAQIDPSAPVSNIATMHEIVYAAEAEQKWFTILLGAMAAIAALFTVVGLYGLVAYSMRRQRSELSLRCALGAQNGDIVTLMARRFGFWICAGLAAGIYSTYAGSSLLANHLDGAAIRGPKLYLLVSSALLLISLFIVFFAVRNGLSKPRSRLAKLD